MLARRNIKRKTRSAKRLGIISPSDRLAGVFPAPALSLADISPKDRFGGNSNGSPGQATKKHSVSGNAAGRAYPIVDAGMRELWATGWMHNRVRMIAASFLVKHLADTLAGRGRMVLGHARGRRPGQQFCQLAVGGGMRRGRRSLSSVSSIRYCRAEKFDPDGVYVRRWVPELAGLPNRHIHEPWKALKQELKNVGVLLGKDYPFPVVDHATARLGALDAFSQMNKQAERKTR